MCVCVCVYIYIYIYMCIYVYIYVCTSVDRVDATSMLTAGATTNTTVKNSRASRESGLLCSLSHGESLAVQVPDEAEDGLQNVHLMLHSKNTLRDYTQYLAACCAFWADMENMKMNAGWDYRSSLMHLNKKYIVPERGRRKHAWLWTVLRQTVYDRCVSIYMYLCICV